MECTAPVPAGPGGDLDWRSVLAGVRRKLRRYLPEIDGTVLDDLSQEGVVAVWRTSQREPIQNLEGLLTTVAARKASDYIRRRVIVGKYIMQTDDLPDVEGASGTPAGIDRLGWVVDRLIFQVRQFFTGRGDHRCLSLFEMVVRGVPWKEVAARLGMNDALARKHWSNCLKRVREVARGSPGWVDLWEEYGELGDA